MIYAIPVFENGKCYLRFSSNSKDRVVIKSIVIGREPSIGGASPQILEPNIEIYPGREIEYDLTNALIKHVAVNTLEERVSIVHSEFGCSPQDDDQPEGIYRVVSQGKSIAAFSSD